MSITLIVEDGSSVTGANTYSSLQDAFNFHLSRQNTDFTNGFTDFTSFSASNTDPQSLALIQASFNLDMLYGPSYIGYPATNTQGLLWPRIPRTYGSAYSYDYVALQSAGGLRDAWGQFRPTNTIPNELKSATWQAALQLLQGDVLTPTTVDNTGFIKEQDDRLDTLRTRSTYFRPVSQAPVSLLNKILFPILNRGNLLVRG